MVPRCLCGLRRSLAPAIPSCESSCIACMASDLDRHDIDGVVERAGAELIGYTRRAGSLADMRASDEPHFIKTHRQLDADADVDDNDPGHLPGSRRS